MKKIILNMLLVFTVLSAASQTTKTALYDLVKKMLYDSTGYENVGDWSVDQPKKYPVKWKTEGIVMSDDTSINFYRLGAADIMIKGRSFTQAAIPVKWNIMLKGPRMGYTSFSIISTPGKDFQPRYTLDSLFGKKSFTSKILKICDSKALSGYYYYELKIPKKDPAFIKLSWLSLNGNTAIRIDCYDSWSKYAVKLDCPK